MKKEFSALMQFIIIACLAAVYFSLVMPLKYAGLSIEAMESVISEVRFWLYSFIGLGAIRFGLFYIIFRKSYVDTNKSQLKLFFDEIVKTSQYLMIAVVAVFFAFWLLLSSLFSDGGGFSFDLWTLWLGIRHSSFIWLSAFACLGLFRLGIILIWNYLFHNRKFAGL